MSITHIYKKYKRILSLIIIISSILMYLSSLFIIGYIEGFDKDNDYVVEVLNKTLDRQIVYSEVKEKGSVVASKSGKRYYFPWCSGINRIKNENKIYFNTELEAKDSGLTLSKTCL